MNEIEKQEKEIVAFNELQAERQALLDRCKTLEVKDEVTLKIATTALAELKDFGKGITELKDALKRPIIDKGNEIDKLYKSFYNPINDMLQDGKNKIIAYHKAQEEKARKEQERIAGLRKELENYSKTSMIGIDNCVNMDELNYVFDKDVRRFPGVEKWGVLDEEAQKVRANLKAFCSAKKIQLTTPEESDDQLIEDIKEVVQEQVAEAGKEEIKQAAFSSSTSFRGTWQFKLVDINSVPKEWLIVDEKKVKEYIKDNKESFEENPMQNGFHFYLEKSVIIK